MLIGYKTTPLRANRPVPPADINSPQHLELPTVLLVDKDVSVLDVALVHERDDLVDLVHRSLLNPRLDLVLDGEVEHLGDQRRRALVTSGEVCEASE